MAEANEVRVSGGEPPCDVMFNGLMMPAAMADALRSQSSASANSANTFGHPGSPPFRAVHFCPIASAVPATISASKAKVPLRKRAIILDGREAQAPSDEDFAPPPIVPTSKRPICGRLAVTAASAATQKRSAISRGVIAS